jgi:hypothetical protein
MPSVCTLSTTLCLFSTHLFLPILLPLRGENDFTNFYFIFFQYWGLNSDLHLEALLYQCFFMMGFLSLVNHLSELALNLDPPDLCLLST